MSFYRPWAFQHHTKITKWSMEIENTLISVRKAHILTQGQINTGVAQEQKLNVQQSMPEIKKVGVLE